MGNESGEWIMYGVEWDDPECIHTVECCFVNAPNIQNSGCNKFSIN